MDLSPSATTRAAEAGEGEGAAVAEADVVMATMGGRRQLEKTPSGYDITIGLEDERGQHAPVDIDEADDVITNECSDREYGVGC